MPTLSQTNFTAGEISDKLLARTDISKFANGARTVRNMVVLKHGGVTRRPGTRYVATANGAASAARLIPFQFSTEQAYVLELSDAAIRIFRNRGQIVADDTDAAVTNGTFDSDLSGWTVSSAVHNATESAAQLNTGGYVEQAITVADDTQEVVIVWAVKAGAAGKSHSADLTVGSTSGGTDIVSAVGSAVGFHMHSFTPTGAATFYVRFTRTQGTPLIDDVRFVDDAPVEIGSPFSADDIPNLQFAQSADVLFLASRSAPPYKLSRQGHKRWALEMIDFISDPFDAEDKYPGAVVFHEDRLCWGGTNERPQTLWLSKTGDYENHTTGADADHAIEITLSSNEVNAIRWLVSGEALFVGTVGGEWRVFASDLSEALTPNNANARRSTTRGSAPTQALQIDDVVLYVQRARQKIREFAYVFEADAYRSPDLTLLAEHVTADRINGVVFQQEPHAIIWTYDDLGRLLGMTYDREQNVIGWHRHDLGGSFGAGPAIVESLATIPSPDARCDDLWVLAKRTVNGATTRMVEFLTSFYDPREDRDIADAFFIDSGLSLDRWNQDPAKTMTLTASNYVAGQSGTMTAGGHTPFVAEDVGRSYRLRLRVYDPIAGGYASQDAEATIAGFTDASTVTVTFDRLVPTALRAAALYEWAELVTTLSGLDHLEGETVQILADGGVESSQVVASGTIALPTPAAVAHAGLGYLSVVETLPYSLPGQFGSSRSKLAQIDRIAIDFLNTNGAKYGRSASRAAVLPFRRTADLMDEPVPLFSGIKEVGFDGKWGREATVAVTQDLPLPLTVRAILPELTVTS